MKIARFLYQKKIYWGRIEGESVKIIKNNPYAKIEFSKKRLGLDKIKLLPPAEPTKIILVGLNYRDHARELGMKVLDEPIIFLKPPSSLIAHRQNIVYPASSARLDYEAELALVIKKKGRGIPQNKAKDYILGYTCLNDVTARDLQKKDNQWTRAKSFDTFCPLGPYLETCLDDRNLKISSFVNAKLCQDSSTANFIFPVAYLISFISRVMTLYPGDIISTGTPYGVGEIKPGDKVEVEIEGIGRLSNKVY